MERTESPGERWARMLADWAIPEAILDAAPASPYGFDPRLFARAADEAADRETPSRRRARAALPPGGSVLDVGCGAGAASVPLADRARLLVGVDQSAEMLTAFAERAEAAGVAHEEHEGRWPDDAGAAGVCDVVVCHHVAYNVPDLAGFAAALTGHARAAVVVELHDRHPMTWTNPLWLELHGLRRPEGPTADDAVAVLRGLGVEPEVDRWDGPFLLARSGEDQLRASVRRRLCLPEGRDADLRAALGRHPPPAGRRHVTLSWAP